MTSPPTLADAVVQNLSHKNSTIARVIDRPANELRATLMRARRFVLDDGMAALLSDLSNAPFTSTTTRRANVLDALRHSARLPFPTTWVEFNGTAFRRRSIELQAKDPYGQTVTAD